MHRKFMKKLLSHTIRQKEGRRKNNAINKEV